MTSHDGSGRTDNHRFSQPRIAVIGAGVIGLSCALELGRRGANVRVYERGDEPGAGASSRAAGMLGLAYEGPEFTSRALADLARRSMQLWPDFAAGLHELTGGGCSFRADGTLACAVDDESEAKLKAVEAACERLALPFEMLEDGISQVEPALQGRVRRALRLKTDMQVDAQLLVTRLASALRAVEAECVASAPVDRITLRGSGFETPDGERWDKVLLATGAQAEPVAFVDEQGEGRRLGLPQLTPVKGQILALEPLVGAPRHVVRAGALYIVPKHTATLIGGVSEVDAADPSVDRDALDGLRARATRLLPGLAMAQEIGAWAGNRPKSPDGAPIMGETELPGVFVANGHFRNGVLLAPASAEWMAQRMLDGRAPFGQDAFSPDRFDARVEPSHSP